MHKWQYSRGLHDLGNGLYAYLQPDGTWGWSNAGLITAGETSLLIDTLFDLNLTGEMLDTMRRALPAAAHIDMVVNTHANGDHCYGNELVADARIIASRRTAEEMIEGIKPEQFVMFLKQAPAMGEVGRCFQHCFGKFNFENITLTPPRETFEGEMTLYVGDTIAHLIEVGPAHTRGDTLVYLPGERVVFTGDILFIGGHPIMWAGPMRNWLSALDRILAMDVETIVPGHGPITDKKGVTELKGYFEYIYDETRKRFEAGMPASEAAQDIPLDNYATWTDGERIAVNVSTIYRELSGESRESQLPNVMTLFSSMATLYTRG